MKLKDITINYISDKSIHDTLQTLGGGSKIILKDTMTFFWGEGRGFPGNFAVINVT